MKLCGLDDQASNRRQRRSKAAGRAGRRARRNALEAFDGDGCSVVVAAS
jgi:hypothetical protein